MELQKNHKNNGTWLEEEMIEEIVETAEEERGIHPNNSLNDLTAKEWIPETVSVWTQKGLGAKHPEAQIERQHPAPFSFTDVSRLITFFTKSGQTVLDPFVGVGSTLKACALEGRNGIGIELNPYYAQLAEERLEKEVPPMFIHTTSQRVIVGDARTALNDFEEGCIDFVVTSPPYWNILHKKDHKAKQERIANGLDTQYSDDPNDLGNIIDYDQFLEELAIVFGKCSTVLKPRGYMAIIVSDFRHKSKYIMFHAHIADILSERGLDLKGITILYQRHKRVFPYGYPYAYVPNIHHQYIVILQNSK